MAGDIATGKKSPIAARREMAERAEVLAALTPAERSVFIATTEKIIAEYDATELAGELNTALKWIAKDIGYRVTSEADMQYLVIRTAEILKRYYSQFSMRDFRMAFELCITGGLDDYLPKGRDGQAERGHYQQFNAEYICKILNAYKTKRSAVICKAVDALPQPVIERDYEEERRLKNQTRRELIEAYESYKANGILPEISPIAEMLYYNLLAEAGLARPIEVTVIEQKTIYQRIINQYARKGMLGDIRRLKDEGPGAAEVQPGSEKLARRKALIDAFNTMRRNNCNIKDYIKEE